MGVKAILTDIEGTITSLSFVKETLFPYSKENLSAFILSHVKSDPRIPRLIDQVLEESGSTLGEKATPDEKLKLTIEILLRWIEEDKKAMPLKKVQGWLWEEGYRKGDYTGHLYPDAYEKLKELKQKGILLYVYSSGSVKAQQLLFQYSDFGDIENLFSGFFDTKMGGKMDSQSYSAIAKKVGLEPNQILFLSDIEEELMAAEQVGMKTTQLIRKEDYPNKVKSKELRRPILENLTSLAL